MHRAVEPYGEARSDHAILAGLAGRLGVGEAFTDGRDERAWLEHLYDGLARRLARHGIDAPSFEEFWAQGALPLPARDGDQVLSAARVVMVAFDAATQASQELTEPQRQRLLGVG